MSVHTPVSSNGIYFVTFTCFKWLKLIEQTASYNEVYKFFAILNSRGHQVLGYVIMPNHLHLILYYKSDAQSLNTIIGNGKRFIAYEIAKRLKAAKEETILTMLQAGVVAAERQRNKLHQVWQGTFDVKPCRTEKFILQKLNYMHQNPCVERWKLAVNTYDYAHSSAGFYEIGEKANKYVKDYRDFLPLLLDDDILT